MSYEAQKAVIGTLLMDFKEIEKVYHILSPEKFSDEYLGKIYYEIKLAYDEGRNIDVNILTFRLGDLAGLNQLLVQCLDSIVTSNHIEEYADIINKDYKARRLGEILNVNPNPEKVMDQIQNLESQLQELQTDRQTAERSAEQLADEYEKQAFNDNVDLGIDSGFKSLDSKLMGMDSGDITLIGARPAVGKTAFALNMAINIAETGKRVEFFSLEMKDKQIYHRLVSFMSGIESDGH